MTLSKRLEVAAHTIESISKSFPETGIVLGSGLGAFIDQVENPVAIPYADIPYFHQTMVEGHEGRLILGKIKSVNVAILQGRLHAYEGYPIDEVVFPVRVLATLGVKNLLLTNAAGGINSNFVPGDLVLIKDHLNLMGKNPLVGPNIAELGPRFPDMTQAYDLDLMKSALKEAQKLKIKLQQGIYAALLGPTYETPAEIRMLRVLGADMVGMSTVPEVIAASHLGLKLGGISCITNMAAGMKKTKLRHEDIKEQALKVMETFSNLLVSWVSCIG